MKKLQNKKITVMIDEDFQENMQFCKSEFNVNWSEKIKRFVELEMQILTDSRKNNYRDFIKQALDMKKMYDNL